MVALEREALDTVEMILYVEYHAVAAVPGALPRLPQLLALRLVPPLLPVLLLALRRAVPRDAAAGATLQLALEARLAAAIAIPFLGRR